MSAYVMFVLFVVGRKSSVVKSVALSPKAPMEMLKIGTPSARTKKVQLSVDRDGVLVGAADVGLGFCRLATSSLCSAWS